MAKNKALKRLRGILEGMPCGGDLVELLDNAVARERERPEVQAAKHQARLAKARADLAEWRVAECRPDTWQGSLARKAHAEAELAALRMAERCGFVNPDAERRRIIRENGETIASIPETVVQAPGWVKCLAMGVDVAQGGDGSHIEVLTYEQWEAKREAEARRRYEERLKSAVAHEAERRALNLATDAQDQAERIRAAEARGFQNARVQAARFVEDMQEGCSSDEALDALHDVWNKLRKMKLEG